MEGVGARLGRSSSRYGTTTVFTGPVRKWKKKWVHVPPRSNHHNAAAAASSHHPSSVANGVGGNASSRLVLYRWTPISKSNKENNNDGNGENENPNSKDDDPESASDEPPRRKFRYVPSKGMGKSTADMALKRREVVALEEENKDTEENTDDEAKLADTDTNAEEPTSKSDGHYEKPDINDVPMEENQASEEERQDLNVSVLDLSLGSDLNMEPAQDD